MKNFLIILFVFACTTSWSQGLPDFSAIPLDSKADFTAADAAALQTCNYLLTTPFDKNSQSRKDANAFLIKWMVGTPDYSFGVDETATKIAKGNDEFLTLYMTAMTKYCLENKEFAKDFTRVKVNTIKILLTYAENPANKIAPTKYLKKLSEANKKGELEKEM